jgi:hypothetical protein
MDRMKRSPAGLVGLFLVHSIAVLSAQFQPTYDLSLLPGTSFQACNVLAYGRSANDQLGGLVAAADLNGDGANDLIVGTSFGPPERSSAGQIRIWFGSELIGGVKDAAGTAGTPADVTIIGASSNDRMSADGLLKAADVNGDGIDDLLLGASAARGPSDARSQTGEVYVVFGRKYPATFPSTIDLSKKNSPSVTDGADVTVYGAAAGDSEGGSLWIDSDDLNGDGVDDVAIGMSRAGTPVWSGRAYLIFGKKPPLLFPKEIDLAKLNGSGIVDGADVRINGVSEGDRLTHSRAMVTGDVNGDGIADLVLGSYAGDGPADTRTGAGDLYVIFGRPLGSTFPSVVSLALQNSPTVSNGADVTIYGADSGDRDFNISSWLSSLRVADLNGDEVKDIIASAKYADGPSNSRDRAGEVAVVFGRKPPVSFPPVIDLALTNSPAVSNGADVTIYGPAAISEVGSIDRLTTGDVNGDGVNDLMMGDVSADGIAGAKPDAGAVYVVFSHRQPDSFPSQIDLALLNGPGTSNGADVVIHGASAGDGIPSSYNMQTADLNADGISDILFSAYSADGPSDGRSNCGEAYVVYGRATGNPFPTQLDLSNDPGVGADVVIYGANASDLLGHYDALIASDLNRDGFADLILGAHAADGPGEARSTAGEAYVILGGPSHSTSPMIESLPSGQVRLTYSGTPGLPYRVLRSADLNVWQVIGQSTASESGEVIFTDNSPLSAPFFYRLERQ